MKTDKRLQEERELATNAAWGAPGVHSVVDETTFA